MWSLILIPMIFAWYFFLLGLLNDSSILGFSFDIFEAPDHNSGSMQPNGSWDGLIGCLLRDEVDILYAGIAITKERATAIAFTQPYLQSGKTNL